MTPSNKLTQPALLLTILACFLVFSSMSTCMRSSIERRANPSNIEVYDSLYFNNGYYAYWYSYNLKGIYGGIGDFIAISERRTTIEDANEIFVSEYIKGIRKINDSILQVVLTDDTYNQTVSEYKGVKITVSVE